jgi:hypothetical protein
LKETGGREGERVRERKRTWKRQRQVSLHKSVLYSSFIIIFYVDSISCGSVL